MEHKWIIPAILVVLLLYWLSKKYVKPQSTATA